MSFLGNLSIQDLYNKRYKIQDLYNNPHKES